MPESVSQQPILNKNDGRSYSEQRSLDGCGSPGRTRTCDQPVNSRLLYQLSYRGTRVQLEEGAL
jgi:hypothetical protein